MGASIQGFEDVIAASSILTLLKVGVVLRIPYLNASTQALDYYELVGVRHRRRIVVRKAGEDVTEFILTKRGVADVITWLKKQLGVRIYP